MSAQEQVAKSLRRIEEIEREMDERVRRLEKQELELERAMSCPPGVDPIPKTFLSEEN